MSAALTRRAALSGAVATVALVGAAAAATMPIHQPTGISPALLDLLHAAEEAETAHDRFHREVYEPAATKRDAAVEAAQAAFPHIEVNTGVNVHGRDLTWRSDNPIQVAVAKGVVHAGHLDNTRDDYVSAARRIVAADHRYQRAIVRTENAHALGDIYDQTDALAKAWSAANDAVGMFPAATPADLYAKLAFMVANSMGDGVDWLPELLADAARLAKKEG